MSSLQTQDRPLFFCFFFNLCYFCTVEDHGCMSNFCKWAHAIFYLDSLDACADNLSVVVLGAEWTCILALPQKMEGTAITRPL